MQTYFLRKTCRACGSPELVSILNLGMQPPANAFVKTEDFGSEEVFPLELFFCRTCTLVQLLHIVSPELLFRNYLYVSSTSPVFKSHFESYASFIFSEYLKPGQLAVDIGSNDGILLKPLKESGARVLGVDPAVDIARRATLDGIPTLPHFFSPLIAGVVKKRLGTAQVITANNMFAHTDDMDVVLQGVLDLLAPGGVFIVEVAYIKDFLEQSLFDTVYHEHVSYYSVRSLSEMVQIRGFEIIDVIRVETHGGSLRVVMSPIRDGRKSSSSVNLFLKEEEKAGVGVESTYHEFAEKVLRNRADLINLLQNLKDQGKNIIGYGAPAKGNTLLNYCGIGMNLLDYIVDDSSFKQGLFTPGMHIPVVSFEKLVTHPPDYVLILAWNFADAIIRKSSVILPEGTKFIIPVPKAIIR